MAIDFSRRIRHRKVRLSEPHESAEQLRVDAKVDGDLEALLSRVGLELNDEAIGAFRGVHRQVPLARPADLSQLLPDMCRDRAQLGSLLPVHRNSHRLPPPRQPPPPPKPPPPPPLQPRRTYELPARRPLPPRYRPVELRVHGVRLKEPAQARRIVPRLHVVEARDRSLSHCTPSRPTYRKRKQARPAGGRCYIPGYPKVHLFRPGLVRGRRLDGRLLGGLGRHGRRATVTARAPPPGPEGPLGQSDQRSGG